MKLLALDTVFEQCSVAICQEGEVLACQTLAGKYQQSELLLPMIETLLANMDWSLGELSALAFNRGPGAFSGIRINTAAVQGLALAIDVPCIGVSSLQALAYAATKTHRLGNGTRLVAVMDARQNELYVADFICQAGDVHLVGDERLLPYGSDVQAEVMVGDGAKRVSCHTPTLVTATVNAGHIATLAHKAYLAGKGVAPRHAQPVYLRHNAWQTLAEQRAKKQGL